MANRKTRKTDDFAFVGVSQQKVNKRNVEEEIGGSLSSTSKAIDLIEQQAGISTPAHARGAAVKYKTKVLSVTEQKDAKELEILLNSPKYSIVQYKDTWTALGEYKVFIIFTEQLDEKEIENNANK